MNELANAPGQQSDAGHASGGTPARLKAAEGVTVRIMENGKILSLDYDGAVCHHPGSLWWGTAVGFRAMQVAAEALSRDGLWARENLYVVSGHPGPGVKDAIQYVTGLDEPGGYHRVVPEGCDMQCNSRMKYEWWVSDGRRTAHVKLRDGFVPTAFYALSDRLGTPDTTKDDLKLFRTFKVNLSTRIWNAPLEENFTVDVSDTPLRPGELPAVIDAHYFDDVPGGPHNPA